MKKGTGMKIKLIFFFLLLINSCVVSADNYPKNQNIDILHYKFELCLFDTTNSIKGKTEMTIRFLTDSVNAFTLDLIGRKTISDSFGMCVQSIFEDSTAVEFRHEENRVNISTASPTKGNEIRLYTIKYAGLPEDGLVISKNKYGDRTFFGDNWPDRARYWLPTIDHPSDKAVCEFVIKAPSHYQVVANGTLTEITNISKHTTQTIWRSQAPLPTKVMVIGVARFAVQYLGDSCNIPVQSWVYPQDKYPGFYDFEQAVTIVPIFEDCIGTFPYAKLANVQSKTRYGGMENASAIFYSERAVRGNRRNEGLLAHEIAHQWFGDAVSEADWHHVWLSEGFATYFTHIYNEYKYGTDRLRRDLERDRQRIISYYERNPSAAVVDTSIMPLTRLLNTNSYQKGSWVLHMLRYEIGEEMFWQSIRDYYEIHKHTSITTDDFKRVVESICQRELLWFFDQWIYRPGHPKLVGRWKYNKKMKNISLVIKQDLNNTIPFRFPLEIGLQSEGDTFSNIEVLYIDEAQEMFSISVEKKPINIILDPHTWLLFEADFREKK